MTLFHRNPQLDWDRKIQEFLYTKCDIYYAGLIPEYHLERNVDFIKTILLHKLRLIYFAEDTVTIKKKVLDYLMAVIFHHEIIKPLAEDPASKQYVTKIFSDVIEQGDKLAEIFVKYDLHIAIESFGFLGAKNYSYILQSVCRDHCKEMNIDFYQLNKNKLAKIISWANKINKARPDAADGIVRAYYLMKNFFFAVMLLSAGLMTIGNTLLGACLLFPSAILGLIYKSSFDKENNERIKICQKSLINLASNLVSLEIHREKKIFRLQLHSTITSNYIDCTVEKKPQRLSGHAYLNQSLPRVENAESIEVIQPKVASLQLEVIDKYHVRFPYQNKIIIDAYLVEAALPADSQESTAVINAFQKGYMPSSKGKPVHAIVREGKSFKIKTSFNGRMRSTYHQINETHAEIIFNQYDWNAHNSKRQKKEKAAVHALPNSAPALR